MGSAGTRGCLVWRRHGFLKETELVDASKTIPSASEQPTEISPTFEQEPEEPPLSVAPTLTGATVHPRLLPVQLTVHARHGEPRCVAAVQFVVFMRSVTG